MPPPSKRIPPPPPGFPALHRRYSVSKTDESSQNERVNVENTDWNPVKFGKHVINNISGSDFTSPPTITMEENIVDAIGTMNSVAVGIYDKVVTTIVGENDKDYDKQQNKKLQYIEEFELFENKSKEQWSEMLELISSVSIAEIETMSTLNLTNFKKQEADWFNTTDHSEESDLNTTFENIEVLKWKYLQDDDSSTIETSGANGEVISDQSSKRSEIRNKFKLLIEEHGISPQFRRRLWVIWSGSLDIRSQYVDYYMDTLSTVNTEVSEEERESFVDLIEKDVNRTCMEIPLFRDGDGSAVLTRILIGFARMCPDLTYVQGMSSLGAFILIAFNGNGKARAFLSDEDDDVRSKTPITADTINSQCEIDVFWTFYALINNRLNGYFDEGMSGLISDTLLLNSCLEYTDTRPQTSAQSDSETFSSVLKSHVEFDWLILTPDWFLQIFADSCQPNVSLHVWDLLFFLKDGDSPPSSTLNSSDRNNNIDDNNSVDGITNSQTFLPSGRVALIWLIVGMVNKNKSKYLEFHRSNRGGLCMQKCCEFFRLDVSSLSSLEEVSNQIKLHEMMRMVKQLIASRSKQDQDLERSRSRLSKRGSLTSRRGRISKSPSLNISRSAARKKAASKAAEDRVVVAAPNSNLLFKMNFM